MLALNKRKTASLGLGCYVGVTHAAFIKGTTKWFNLLHLSAVSPDVHSICKEVTFASCATMTIWDLIVADNHILMLTSKGVVRSEDIFEVTKAMTTSKVKFYHVSSIHEAIDIKFKDGSFKQNDAELHFTQKCPPYGEQTEQRGDSAAYLVFHLYDRNAHISGSMVFVSNSPFETWKQLKFERDSENSLEKCIIHGIAEDIQRQSTVMLMEDTKQSRNLFVVYGDGMNRLFPMYKFPEETRLEDLYLDSYTNNVYVYGNQVWCSTDNGGSFHKIKQLLVNDFVVSFGITYIGESITFTTKLGSVYYGKPGVLRVSRLESADYFPNASFVIGSDQQGHIYKVSLASKNSVLTLDRATYDVRSLVKASILRYSRPLFVQLITERQVQFSVYCNDSFFNDLSPCIETFNSANIGMVIKTKNGGAAVITRLKTPANRSIVFGQQMEAIIISPFPEDNTSTTPALMFHLEVKWQGKTATLSLLKSQITHDGWLGNDIGKTVILSDGTSFIISECINVTTAFAKSLAFSEGRYPAYHVINEEGSWAIYDFRPFDAIRALDEQVLVVSSESGEKNQVHLPAGNLTFLHIHVGMMFKVGTNMGIIDSVVNTSSAMINFGSQRNTVAGSYKGGWGLIKSYSNKSATLPTLHEIWWLVEHDCQSIIWGDYKVGKHSCYLDSKDELHLSVNAVRKDAAYNIHPSKAILTAFIGNPRLFAADPRYLSSQLYHTLHLTLKQRPLASGMSFVAVSLQEVSLLCQSTSLRISVYSQCPPTKRLRFTYPVLLSRNRFMSGTAADKKGIIRSFRLPYNYRPPSSRGKAIPMSSNIYNAHPEKPLYRNAYAVTKSNLRYKQCRGKRDRKLCKCTAHMESSSYEMHSDCICTVYRLLYGETLKPKFQVLQDGRGKLLAFPYYLVELNQRNDFKILHTSKMNNTNLQVPILEQSQNSTIEFEGSGLFHFRAHIVQKGFTFCSMTDEFVVYIDEAPLPHPIQDIVRACTGMAFACLLYVVYMLKFYGKNKMKNE